VGLVDVVLGHARASRNEPQGTGNFPERRKW
jgi:hypothetical protein